MKCESCGQGEAVVQFTHIENNDMTTLHLCQTCAAERGLETDPVAGTNAPLTDFLAQLGGKLPKDGSFEVDGACDFCGLTLRDFRETGRFGCPQCYTSFEKGLRGLLRRIHGATQHVGKVYLPTDPTEAERAVRQEALRKKLERAVEGQHFERAAQLRDQLRALERA